jgi:hypothetical protein
MMRQSGMKPTLAPIDKQFTTPIKLKNAWDFQLLPTLKREDNVFLMQALDHLDLGLGVPDARYIYMQTCKLLFSDKKTKRGLV